MFAVRKSPLLTRTQPPSPCGLRPHLRQWTIGFLICVPRRRRDVWLQSAADCYGFRACGQPRGVDSERAADCARAASTVTRRSRPKSCLGTQQSLPSHGLSAGSRRRQWRTLTYAFVPKKAFERIPDASTPSRPLSGYCEADGSLNASAQARDCSRTQTPTAESSPPPENFFAKLLPQKGYPLSGAETVFGQIFGRGGMIKFSK